MAETHLTADEEMVVESHTPYFKVWIALLILTLIEYFYAKAFSNSFATLVLGLMFWAVIKAGLVGWYFMHLKYEGNWVYGFLVPAGILATVLIFGLTPDIALNFSEENPAEDEPLTASISVPRNSETLRFQVTV